MKKSIVVFLTIIYFITLGMFLFFFRYSIIPTHGSLTQAYKLNRLTGKVTRIAGFYEYSMKVSEPPPRFTIEGPLPEEGAKKKSVFDDLPSEKSQSEKK